MHRRLSSNSLNWILMSWRLWRLFLNQIGALELHLVLIKLMHLPSSNVLREWKWDTRGVFFCLLCLQCSSFLILHRFTQLARWRTLEWAQTWMQVSRTEPGNWGSVCLCVCVYMSEDNLGWCSSGTVYLCFVKQGLSLAWRSLGKLSVPPQGWDCKCILHALFLFLCEYWALKS